MRVMDWFKRFFSGSAGQTENLSIEIDSIVEKFQLVKEAKRLANMGLPAFHEKKPTSLELSVVEHVNQLREEAQRDFLRRQEDINSRVLSFEIKHQSMQSDVLNAEFERQARKIMDEQGAWLKKLAYSAMTRFKELEAFKKQNGLEREANYPSTSGLVLRYSMLVFLVVVEGILNANFFAEGLSSGLIGGFVYAALLAAINVVGCFFLGKYALPWLVSKPVAGKAFGIFSLLFTACFMLLVAMSMGFGIASVFDGLTIDDMYPGYGAVVRRCNTTRDEFEAEFEEIREELEDLKQEKLDLINQGFKTLHELIASLRKLVLEKEALQREFADKLTQSEVVVYAVLRKFRMENEIARDDGLRPGYFDHLPALDPVNVPRVSNDSEQALITKLEQDIRVYENTVNEQREKVYNLYEQCISRLNHLKYH